MNCRRTGKPLLDFQDVKALKKISHREVEEECNVKQGAELAGSGYTPVALVGP